MTNEQREKLLKKADKISGLRKCLEERLEYHAREGFGGVVEIEDLKIDSKRQAGAYILDYHYWEKGCPINYAVRVGAWLNQDQGLAQEEVYCSSSCNSSTNPNWGKHYTKVKDMKIKNGTLVVNVASPSEKQKYTFYITERRC